MKEDLANIQDNNTRFISASPHERYLNLLDTRPDLIDRVPQHQLASLLGMKPESLSSIKRWFNLQNRAFFKINQSAKLNSPKAIGTAKKSYNCEARAVMSGPSKVKVWMIIQLTPASNNK